jgi:hypothetical protein
MDKGIQGSGFTRWNAAFFMVPFQLSAPDLVEPQHCAKRPIVLDPVDAGM